MSDQAAGAAHPAALAPGLCQEPLRQNLRPGEVLIVALGNPLRGDDGVGAAILEALAGAGGLPHGMELLECSPGRLLDRLYGARYRKLIILDAADMGLPAGQWVRFTPAEADLPIEADTFGSLHSSGLADALALAEALDLLPDDTVIYGVQPEILGYAAGLSEPVRRAVPEICAALLEECLEMDILEQGDKPWLKFW